MSRYEPGCRHLGLHRSMCVSACAATGGAQVAWGVSVWRIGRLAAVVLFGVPLAAAVMAVPGYARQRRRSAALLRLSRAVLAAAGVRLQVAGSPRTGPSLVVANHNSWLDLLALCAAAPMVPVAKREVADWPVIGAVARRCGTVFLRRESLRELTTAIDEMTVLLRQGHRVQVFPEATTRCGLALDEFYRAGFQAALNAAVVVQPAAVRLTQLDVDTTATAFVGTQTLAAALLRVVRLRDVGVELRWLLPIPAIAGTGRAAVDRATVARLSQNAISRSLGRSVVARSGSGFPGTRVHPLQGISAVPALHPMTRDRSWQSVVSQGRF